MHTIGVNQYHGVVRSLIDMAKKEGWGGFFKGNGTNVIRIAPYSAIQFLSYEKFKKVWFSTPSPALFSPVSDDAKRRAQTFITSREFNGRRNGGSHLTALYIPIRSYQISAYCSNNRNKIYRNYGHI